jgi:uncharacterized membrane protein YgcG
VLAPSRRSAPLAVLGTWVAVAVVGASASAWAWTQDDIEASAAVELTNDAGGHPMFSSSVDLVPGNSRAACLAVSATGAGPDDEVRLGVRGLTGTLASHLLLDVYLGTGGGYGNCTGFTGGRIYHGTLQGLAGLGAAGVNSGWKPGGSSARTFEFIVTVADDPTAQGTSAGATFSWQLDAETPPVTPTPTRTPTPKPTRTPMPTPTTTRTPTPSGTSPATPGTGSPGTGSPGAGSPVTGSPGSGSPGSGSPGSGSPGSGSPGSGSPGSGSPGGGSTGGPTVPGAGSAGPGSGHADVTLTHSLPNRLIRTMIGVLAKPQFTLIPLLLALIFMLIQHRIDARDPKLVNASRTKRDMTLTFPDEFPEAVQL